MRVLLSSIRLANSPVLERNLPEILVNDRIMTCSSLADIDKCTVLRQFLHVPSAIAEIMSIFLRISYPPLKALKNPVISPERKAKLSVTLFLRGLSSDFCVQPKFYSYPRSPLFLGALGKAKVLLAPRACLKTMLLQAYCLVSVFVHSKILFPFVQNTVWPDRPAALFLIPQICWQQKNE